MTFAQRKWEPVGKGGQLQGPRSAGVGTSSQRGGCELWKGISYWSKAGELWRVGTEEVCSVTDILLAVNWGQWGNAGQTVKWREGLWIPNRWECGSGGGSSDQIRQPTSPRGRLNNLEGASKFGFQRLKALILGKVIYLFSLNWETWVNVLK